jgi:acyl-CoA synthetase (AMP-forming)/AMP-acid ligase II
VKECAAIVLEQNDIKTIYLAAAPETGQVVTEDELLSWCARQIPVYAVPAAAFIFAEFGRTSTGKIDRQKVRTDVNTLLHGTAVS